MLVSCSKGSNRVQRPLGLLLNRFINIFHEHLIFSLNIGPLGGFPNTTSITLFFKATLNYYLSGLPKNVVFDI